MSDRVPSDAAAAELAAVTRERDLLRAECRAWRAWMRDEGNGASASDAVNAACAATNEAGALGEDQP